LKRVLHGASKNTADNPDTLNEVKVCGVKNLIRFKTGYFQVMGKRDEWKCGGEEERTRRKTELKVGHYKCKKEVGTACRALREKTNRGENLQAAD
jgi:hypothetical protein